jgi:hypothetical protein
VAKSVVKVLEAVRHQPYLSREPEHPGVPNMGLGPDGCKATHAGGRGRTSA